MITKMVKVERDWHDSIMLGLMAGIWVKVVFFL